MEKGQLFLIELQLTRTDGNRKSPAGKHDGNNWGSKIY